MSGMAWWRQAIDRASARAGLGEVSEADLIARRDELLRQRLAKSSYCTTTNPQPGCTPLPGIAKPMRADALASFKTLQAQLNRLLQHFRAAPVAVDGRIGSGVMNGLDLVRAGIPFAHIVLPELSLDQTAETAEAGGTVLRLLADNLELPPAAPAAPSVASVVQPGGGVSHPPDRTVLATAGLGPAGSPTWLLLAAAGVAAALLLWKSPAPKSRRRRRSR